MCPRASLEKAPFHEILPLHSHLPPCLCPNLFKLPIKVNNGLLTKKLAVFPMIKGSVVVCRVK